MIRAAAKNSAFAAVVVDPSDYPAVLAELRESEGRLSSADPLGARAQGVRLHRPLRRRHLRVVLALLRGLPPELERGLREGPRPALRREPPPAGRLLRPRRRAAPTCSRASPSCTARSCRSTTCSTSAPPANWSKTSASPPARSSSTTTPAAARSPTAPAEAYARAFACDPQSAYGGVIALNRPVDGAAAEKLSGQFIEVLLAPSFEPAALEILQQKKNVRLLELPDWPQRTERVEAPRRARRAARPDPRRGHRDTRADAGDDQPPSRPRSSGRTSCSRGGCAATFAPTRS